MRVNVYAEEMTDRVEIIGKEIDGHYFTGLRFYLELPATGADGTQHQGPFMHRPGDDDSSAVTFWGKRDLRVMLRQALALLDEHYAPKRAESALRQAKAPPREPIGRVEGANESMPYPHFVRLRELTAADVGNNLYAEKPREFPRDILSDGDGAEQLRR